MRLFFAIVVSAAALLAAPQDKKNAEPVRDGSKPMAIPAGATQTSDGDYHYTDPQGKKWIYRRTPFGVARLEERTDEQVAKSKADALAGTKATEAGDKVKFERMGPFGLWKWEKKISELDEAEKAALQKSRDEKSSKQE
jgi:opacity protein-like surface antigen